MAFCSSIAAASPSVSITVGTSLADAEASARVEAVRRRLLADALRHGYCVKRSDAQASLHVELGPTVHRIMARGESVVEVHLEGGGLVADLEVIHRSHAVLMDAIGTGVGHGCEDSGSVELRVEGAVQSTDEEQLVAGLVDAGYSVATGEGDAVVCLRGGPDGTSVAHACDASVAEPESGDLVARAVAVVQAQAVPEQRKEAPKALPAKAAAPVPPPQVAAPKQPEPSPGAKRSALGGRVDVSVGMLVRERSVDPSVGLQGGPVWRGRWGLELGTVATIAALSPELTALDVDLGVAATHTWILHPRWSIGVGLGGGARFHPYFVRGQAQAGATTGQGQASLVGRFTARNGVGVGLSVRPVVAGNGWEHNVDGVALGRRTFWGVRFAIELGWGRS